MTESTIASALLAITTGLALAHMQSRALAVLIVIFAGAHLLALGPILPRPKAEVVAAAAGVSTIIAALAVYWPGRLPVPLAASLAINSGIWCGLHARVVEPWWVLATIAPVLAALPARWMVGLSVNWPGMMVKIFAGWALAIAILTTALPYLLTPGSQSDHVD